jgi:hypothetical protein
MDARDWFLTGYPVLRFADFHCGIAFITNEFGSPCIAESPIRNYHIGVVSAVSVANAANSSQCHARKSEKKPLIALLEYAVDDTENQQHPMPADISAAQIELPTSVASLCIA